MKHEVSGQLVLLLTIFDNQDAIDLSGLKEVMDGLRATLSPTENEVLALHFGLDTNSSMTVTEIGEFVEITPEQVALHLKTALRKLRHPSRSRKLSGFIEPFILKDRPIAS